MFERDVPKAVSFFKHGIGASLKVMTEQWAELQAGDTILALKSAPGYVVVVVVLFLLLLLVTIVPFRLFLSVSLSLSLSSSPFFFPPQDETENLAQLPQGSPVFHRVFTHGGVQRG